MERIGDNERTEEVLEAMEEQSSRGANGSSRNVLDKRGQKPSTESQDKKWPEDMTKGEQPRISCELIITDTNRQNVDNTITVI